MKVRASVTGCVLVSGGGLDASLAHHVVRLCCAAMSDRQFHQRQTQRSRFLTLPLFLHPYYSLIRYESHACFFSRIAYSTLLLHIYVIVILQDGEKKRAQ